MSDDERTFTWPRAPAEVYVSDDHECSVGELFGGMMARRDALRYETNADDLVGCVDVVAVDDVDDAFTRCGWTDPPAAADLDADLDAELDNHEGTQP